MRCRHRDKGNRVNLEPKADVFGCLRLRTDAGNSRFSQLYGLSALYGTSEFIYVDVKVGTVAEWRLSRRSRLG